MMNYIIDHIGYITGNIIFTANEFKRLGYAVGGVTLDDVQKTKICFLSKPNEVCIELVEPYEDNRTMQNFLAKRGVCPYHICYKVDDVELEYKKLIEANWIALFQPVAAPAFDNRKICYFWNSEIGFIELVNK